MEKEYISIQQTAENWNMSKRRIQVLCREGRITGAKKIGNMWVLPKDLEKPVDARCRTPVCRSREANHNHMKNALKKLLKIMYGQLSEKGLPEEIQRTTVLASIACALVMHYTKAPEKNVYEKIRQGFDDCAGEETELVYTAGAFVRQYQKDAEIDSIVSWAYQYSNKRPGSCSYAKTQFFTEQYMIRFLIRHMDSLLQADKIVDPCCGGGNFLLECLEFLCSQKPAKKEDVLHAAEKLYGYDIDPGIAGIALINLKIKVMSVLYRAGVCLELSFWDEIKPNLFVSETENAGGALDFSKEHAVRDLRDGTILTIIQALGNADVVLTNPPFETVKGMEEARRDFLKKAYAVSNCDTCAAFLQVIASMLKSRGECGIVSQNAWMFLKTFEPYRLEIRRQYQIRYILNLGAGAFADLSGEKTNISLMIMRKEALSDHDVYYLDLSRENYETKKRTVMENRMKFQSFAFREVCQDACGFDFSMNTKMKKLLECGEQYRQVAVPMQGTSTGNAKKLVGYFWEHFGDEEWRLVSKGGGYCRWEGLNHSVVRWGKQGEYIRSQHGCALRNTRYFGQTFMVYSDTGTSGLNVRIMLPSQIFIASGPGIRVCKGNAYAQLAYLNSRLAACYIRKMSPKLTIAAGYIGKLPICGQVCDSVMLEKNARLCIALKQKFLCTRPSNYEYDASFLKGFCGSLGECALQWFLNDLKDELLKLEVEDQIDQWILRQFRFGEEERKILAENVGICAVQIQHTQKVDAVKLDAYTAKLLNEECTLNRTRTGKKETGCDGILEYLAKDLKLSPSYLVREIEGNLDCFALVRQKYQNLLLHNEILDQMRYSVKSGVLVHALQTADVSDFIRKKYAYDPRIWIEEKFEDVHSAIFRNVPFLACGSNSIIRKAVHNA